MRAAIFREVSQAKVLRCLSAQQVDAADGAVKRIPIYGRISSSWWEAAQAPLPG